MAVTRGGVHYIYFGKGACHRERYLFSRYWYKSGIHFQNFGIRNGTHFQDFYMKYIRSGILLRKIGIRSGILFQNIGIRNRYVFEASMARPRPKSGQVHPPGAVTEGHFDHLKKLVRFSKHEDFCEF